MSDNINQDIAISGEGNIVVGKGDVIINPLPPAEARLRHDLGILLKNVETTWIKGVLENSVHEAALLELGMELREEAVDNPWNMVIERPDQSREVLPRGRKIKDIFDEANRLLLILGEPGSGKTTTLLQLARDLIAEVDQAFTQPVPVILNLSTWTNKQQPLDEWLIGELNSKYRLPKKDGKKWLKDRRILPLLDGLDEVKPENRAACVEKINQLVVDYGLQGLVVCSRIKDYTDLNVGLSFYRAIYIQPLTLEQVDEYLNQAGEKLTSLRAILQSDEALRSMAQSPLILNIMSLSYQDTSAEELGNPTLTTDKARRNHLFDTYIARMFHRKAGGQEYDDEQTKRALSWLARNMQVHNQDAFLIENLQPSWFTMRSWQWIYAFVTRLSDGLILGIIFGLLLERIDVVGGLTAGMLFGLSVGMAVGFIDILRFEWFRNRKRTREYSPVWWLVINVVIIWLSIAMAVALVIIMLYGAALEDFGFIAGLTLTVGLIPGLVFGLRNRQRSLENDIQTVEALSWSWRKALNGVIIGGIFGVLFGGLFGWLAFPLMGGGFSGVRLSDWLSIGLICGLTFGFIGGPIGAVFSGLSREIIETKTVPNQGILLSNRTAAFGGLIVGLIFFSLIFGLGVGLVFGLGGGLFFGLLGALWYGGLDVIQHYTLRLILVIQGHTPANYARFLDYAVDRIFLQKVGGGYRFIHRLLLEHFANTGETAKKV